MPPEEKSGDVMKELIRSNDMVLISFLEHCLGEEGIECLMLDGHMSILEGSLGVLPRRMMVDDDDHKRASEILDDIRRDKGGEL
jgi:hypothetical protein